MIGYRLGGVKSACEHPSFAQGLVIFANYSLIQKDGYTFATVHRSKCVTVFLNQTLDVPSSRLAFLVLKLHVLQTWHLKFKQLRAPVVQNCTFDTP